MRRWSTWLALATVVFACATATAAMGGAPAERHQAAAVADPRPDTDRDGLTDDSEVRRYRTDPRRPDTDRDGLRDGPEVLRYRTNPRSSDTDRDGLSDGAEVGRFRTDPRTRDTDRDGLFDGDEVRRYKTSARVKDSDGDGWGDGVEIKRDTDPGDRRNRPGFPREDNTGVPPGTVLTPYSGPSNITTAGTVIDAKNITGCLEVSAPKVTIKRSKITCNGPKGIHSNSSNLLIEDVEINCSDGPGCTAIGDQNFTARRVNVYGGENLIWGEYNVAIEDSFIHDQVDHTATDCPVEEGSRNCHTDGIQGATSNVRIEHNTIYGYNVAASDFSNSAITLGQGDSHGTVIITNNLLAGGGYTIYCPQNGSDPDVQIRNNRFSTRFGPRVGAFGPHLECEDEPNFTGNVYHETGRPLRLK
jgi:Bacterial TSP3 repeat